MQFSLISILRPFPVLGIVLGCMVSTNVFADGGAITIDQVSHTNQLGTWILQMPNNTTVTHERGDTRTIDELSAGTYSLSVKAPQKSFTTIVAYRGTELITSVDGTKLVFPLTEGAHLRLVVTHRFFGTITVTSDPPGASVSVRGSDTVLYEGVTPHVFHSVPPLYYTAIFEAKEGCNTPRNQHRLLNPNTSLTFHGVYRCDFPAQADIPPPEETKEPEKKKSEPLSITLESHQAEVLPGGTVLYTLTTKNLTRSTIKNLALSVQFDAKDATPVRVKDDGNTVQEGLLVWQIPALYAGRTWQTTFGLTANEALIAGDIIEFSVRASGDDLVEKGATQLHLTERTGVTLLPETGQSIRFLILLLFTEAGLLFALQNCLRRHFALKMA